MTKRILMGKIATAHGIKGLVKVLFFGEDKSLLNGVPLYTSETGDATVTIKLKNALGKYILAEIEGLTDRTAAEALRGTDLYISRDALPDINNNEFYYEDLKGLPVQNVDGEALGKIISPHNFGAGELLEIQPVNGDPYYLPFNEQTVPEITSEYAVIVRPDEIDAPNQTVEIE